MIITIFFTKNNFVFIIFYFRKILLLLITQKKIYTKIIVWQDNIFNSAFRIVTTFKLVW